MKILHVIPSLRKGGAERLVIDISRQLIKLGHTVKIVTFRNENEYQALSKGLTIHVIPSQVNYSISGRNTVETEMFDQLVRDFCPDIIHSHLLEAEFVSRYKTVLNTIYITHWHGCHPPTNPHSIHDYLSRDAWWHLYSIHQLKRQYEKCDNHFLCISEFIGSYVHRAFHPDSKNLRIILNGSDLSQFTGSRTINNSERFILLSVGSFHPYKNQLFLLKVLRHLVEQGNENICIRLLGDGVERKNLEWYVVENKLSEHVEFFGFVDDPSAYMMEADLLVHAAIDEPFGLILLEAMSAGLPIIAFNSGGVPEIVENGKTGFLTEVDDLEGFAKAILKLKSDSSLAAQFSKQGRASVQKFNLHDYVKKIEALYLELLETKQV